MLGREVGVVAPQYVPMVCVVQMVCMAVEVVESIKVTQAGCLSLADRADA